MSRTTVHPTPTKSGPVDIAIEALAGNATRWARLAPRAKVDYLRGIRERVVQHADEWIDVAVAHKGVDRTSPVIGSEEWLGGLYTALMLVSDYIRTLSLVGAGRSPLEGVPVRETAAGQVVVSGYPTAALERVVARRQTVDVLLHPDVASADLDDSVGWFYRQAQPPGRVTAVLGAGNYAVIPFADALTYLVVHGDVVAVKVSPVNEAFGPVLEAMLEPLVADGFVRLLYGGHEVGQSLVHHPGVGAVHLTGSEATYNAIVFGADPYDRARRLATDEPVVTKPVYCELGGVSPSILVPGRWSADEINYQAEHIASQTLHNAGHACISTQVLVVPRDWHQRDQMMASLRRALHTSPDRAAYYPGTSGRRERLQHVSSQVETYGGDSARCLVTGLSPDSDHPAFREELFGPMLMVVDVAGETPAAFLSAAVDFANAGLHGSLGANVIIHPDTARSLGARFIRSVLDLRYGAVAVNTWSAFVFGTPRAPWGAFPGNPRHAIGSGSGFVHNSLMLDRPQRSIAAAPFRDLITPPWFLGNPRSEQLTRAMFHLAATRGSGRSWAR